MVITLFQQDIVWGDPKANIRHIEECLSAAPQSDIILLPETFTTGFGGDMLAVAEPAGGDTLQWLKHMAAEKDALVAGTWVVAEGGHLYNRMHWATPDGATGTYDKAHTFRTSTSTIEWRGCRIRLAVCYDLRFPRWLRNDGLDYDLLLLSSNWPTARRDAWITLLRARAIENIAFVAGCNRSGVDPQNVEYNAPSLIVDYKGGVMAEAVGEQLITADLPLDKMRSFRQRWPFHLDFDAQ